jgi:hypothetical protein
MPCDNNLRSSYFVATSFTIFIQFGVLAFFAVAIRVRPSLFWTATGLLGGFGIIIVA